MVPPSATANGFKSNSNVNSKADKLSSVTDTSPIVTSKQLTVLGVSELRAKSALQFKGGIAATGFSVAFKDDVGGSKPHSKDFSHHLTAESRARESSPLKSAAAYLALPGMISLCGGLPSSAYFPISHIDIGVPSVGGFSEAETAKTGETIRAGKHDIRDGKSLYDLHVALNYGQGTGAPQLVRWVTEHTEIVHNPPYKDWGCIMTVGSTSALDMCLRTLCSIDEYLVTDEYSFASAIETCHGMRIKMLGVAMDHEGMIPSELEKLLSGWDVKIRGAKKPCVLYLVPTGQNPTGSTQGLERRKAIYKIACEHDLLIIEDEPYYFLQMTPYTAGSHATTTEAIEVPASHEEFIKSLVPSYLSFDIEGRVIRLDSFSKVVAPGARCGWVTTNELLTERFHRHNEVSVQAPSGFSSVVLFKLLDEHWGHGGYMDWLVYIRKEYSARRNVLMAACEKYIPTEVASWVAPSAGMFLWIKINARKHTDFKKLGILGVEKAVFEETAKQKALVAKGSWFFSEPEIEHEDMFVRATFAASEPEAMTEAMRRLGIALRILFKLPQLKQE